MVEIPTPNLSSAYWGDINRYCDQIRDCAPVTAKVGRFFTKIEVQEVSWEAEQPNTEVTFTDVNLRVLGGLLGRRRNIDLVLSTSIEGMRERDQYHIRFDPINESVEAPRRRLEFRPPRDIETIEDMIESYKEYKEKSQTFAEQIGGLALHAPRPEDYNLLHNELRRGASSKC